ncbi:DUF4259 domain-containing protein [Kitasatospora sp. NPDC058444]|uniref:DUF4259 domain-containing protein n=1 Tax=Kitasatospora sp. NPDC058444 TaxID=3346504 RepID=UPI00365DDDE5
MGAWGTGPFDNDTAMDFADALDEAAEGERETLVRTALIRTVPARGPLEYLEYLDGTEAVAAAALVAAQCPGDAPIDPGYRPGQALPAFTTDLRSLAVEALDRVVAESSELAELWDEAPGGTKWRQDVRRLRTVLAPDPEPQDALFDL